MSALLPYLRLVNRRTGDSYVVADNCFTMAMIERQLASPRWEVAIDCPECCPTCLDQGAPEDYLIPSEGGAWWGDTTNEASDEWVGLMVDDFTLEPALSSRRRGDTTLEATSYSPRLLELTGRIVANGERGTAYAWESLTRLFSSSSCTDDWVAEVYAFCPPEGEEYVPPTLDGWTPQAEPPLIETFCPVARDDRFPRATSPCVMLSINVAMNDDACKPNCTCTGYTATGDVLAGTISTCISTSINVATNDAASACSCSCEECGCDPCQRQDPAWIPDRLPSATRPDGFVNDSGVRSMMQVRFVSMDRNTDAEIPACDGDSISLTFEVYSEDSYGETISGPCELMNFADDEDRCRPYDWSWSCRVIAEENVDGCGDDPLLESLASLPVPTSISKLGSRNWCSPMWRRTKSCLVPFIPTRGDVGLDLTITAGSGVDVRGLQLDVWQAFAGLPDPASCEGEQLYRAMTPIATLQVPWLPEGGVLKIDSASATVKRSCAGRLFEDAESQVTSPAGRWPFPALDPSVRYWILVSADCLNINADTTVEMAFTPRYVG